MNKTELLLKLFDLGVLQFGSFTLKSGLRSPFYLDFRRIIAYPDVLKSISEHLWDLSKNLEFDHLCGVPYAALSISSTMAVLHQKPMIVKRKEKKKHGTKKMVEGVFEKGHKCVVIDDVVSSGISMIETLEALEQEGLVIKDVLSIVDRMQGGVVALAQAGYKVHSLYNMQEILEILFQNKKIDDTAYADTLNFIRRHRVDFNQLREHGVPKLAYEEISRLTSNNVTKNLLRIMVQKKSNLCCSADVDTKAELLALAEEVGPHICMLKTHMDNVNDFDAELVRELQKIATKHNFLLFEDRKFADIGHIAKKQFVSAPMKIANWADVVTVHVVAGSSSIEALRSTGKLGETGLLVVAEMSTEDSLTTEAYTQEALKIAEKHKDIVVGVISQTQRPGNAGILMCTPGINLSESTDGFGQRYKHPEIAFVQRGIDIMIVGRGIYRAENPAQQAQKYQQVGWESYLHRLN